MKPLPLLLTASLLANVAFVALVATRSSAPSATREPAASASGSSASADARRADALRAALASGDAAAMEAAGIPADVARELALGRIFARMAEKIRASGSKASSDTPWWRPRTTSPAAREQQLLARREFADALLAAFGDDLGLGERDVGLFSFLPSEKRDALRRINQDYDEMMAKFSAGGLQLASDREKLRLLRQERDRDIAALLSPAEREAYEMRTSNSGNTVRNRYGHAIESEAEFQRLYAAQKAFDDKFNRDALVGRIPPEVMRARAEAERQLDADIRAAVGDERYAALRRAADSDVRTVDALVNRLNLPPTTTDTVLASRDTFAAQSQRIANDPSVPPPQRRAQIQALANEAKAELARTLGAEAADAYAQRSPWMSMLQSGMAYSTTPQEGAHGPGFPGGQSVYPVLPAGGATAQRQMVVNAAPPDGAVLGDTFIGGGNVQVLSFTSSTISEQAPVSAAAGVPKAGAVAPAPAAPAASTPAPKP